MEYLILGKNSASIIRMQFNDSSGTALDLSSNTVTVAISALSVSVAASAVTDGTDGDYTATIPAQSSVEDNALYDGQLLVSGSSPIEVEFEAQADGDSGTTPTSYVVAGNTVTVSAAVGGVAATTLDALTDVSTSGASDGQALVYTGSSTSWGPGTVSGGSSTQWGQQADSTTWHLWEDFLSEWTTAGNYSWLAGGVSGGGGMGNIHDSTADEVFGCLKLTDNGGTSSCSMATTGTLSKATPEDGDVIILEANLKPDTSGGGETGLAIGGMVNSNYENDCLGFAQVGGSTDPHRVVVGYLNGATNLRYAAGNSNDFTLSTSDTGTAAADSYVRLAIKLVYQSSGSEWLYVVYVNGSSAGNGTLDGANPIAGQVYARGQGSGNATLIDWMHCQFERGAVTYVT